MPETATEAPPRPPWHATPVTDVARDLKTDVDTGLTQSEAQSRLLTSGLNVIAQRPRWTRLKRMGNQFKDVLIWLLLAAAATSALVLDAWFDAGAIVAIVLLNAGIGYAQESKADSALESLRDLEAPLASVVRDGVAATIDARNLVPGDLLLLDAGDQVPADARLAHAIRLIANEAPLTGESLPVTKTVDPAPPEAVVGDRVSMVFAGTAVVAGRGKAIVTATGIETEVGQIAALFSTEQPRTPLQVELARVGRRLAMVALAAAVLIFGAGLARSFPIETMALTAVALAVAAIPEGLPAVVTVSLAGGLQRMAHRNAIVRRLPAVEALGAVDVVCTDKTGTLTAADLEVGSVMLADGREGLELLAADDRSARSLTMSAVLCNDAYRSKEGFAGDPTEVALLVALEEAGVDVDALRAAEPRLDEAGFDGRRKRMSTLHGSDEGFLLRLKGAPEVLLARSATYSSEDGEEPVDEAHLARLHAKADEMAGNGMRTLAFAVRHLVGRPQDPLDEEHDLCFLGLVGLHERIRPDVPSAVGLAADAGVTTVMVTGDHATTARAVAKAVGLEPGMAMQGEELSETPTDGLRDAVSDYRVFARVDPVDKVKIIEAWQASGATVAMTGDGVNDAPALHRADIGVAMGSGTDVAREAAAMVLADDNYATIVSAIAEGRRLFNNLRNVVHYLLSANASEVLYVLGGFLFFGFLGEPLLAVQILWINLLSDALPAIALGMDRPTRDLMEDRPGQGRDVLSGRNTALLLVQGTVLAGAALLAMIMGTFVLDFDHATVQTMVFTTLVFSQLLHALSVRAADGPMRRPGRLMVGSLLGSALLHIAVIYTAIGNSFLQTVPLDATVLMMVIAISIASMVAVRLLNRTKRWMAENEHR